MINLKGFFQKISEAMGKEINFIPFVEFVDNMLCVVRRHTGISACFFAILEINLLTFKKKTYCNLCNFAEILLKFCLVFSSL